MDLSLKGAVSDRLMQTLVNVRLTHHAFRGLQCSETVNDERLTEKRECMVPLVSFPKVKGVIGKRLYWT